MPELDRRDFLKVVGLSAGAAATAACQEPVEKVIPYLVQPEEIIPGIPTYYASACRECPIGCSQQVKTREGRPIKVDVSPDDPISSAGLCVRGQAGLNRTYDDLRFRGPMRRNGDRLEPISWDEGIKLLVDKLGATAAGRVTFLGGLETGTLDALIDEFLGKVGSPDGRVRFELYAQEALRSANGQVFGTEAVPQFDIGRSDLVLSFGADFLETWLNAPQNQQGYADSRRNGKGYAIYVGPRLGMTGGNTDEWIAPEPGTEVFVALALAHELAGGSTPELGNLLEPFAIDQVAGRTGVPAETLRAVAARIRDAKAPIALPPGNEIQGTNATSFTAAVQILNYVSGAINQTVRFGPDHNLGSLARFRDLKELAARIHGGEVDVLLVHQANPVYAMPTAFGLAEALRKVSFVVSFSSAPDETTELAHLVLPDNTPYESWGDVETVRGVRRLQQPTVRPLFDTRALGDVLLDTGRGLGMDGLPETFHARLMERWGGRTAFEAALAVGGAAAPAAARPVALAASVRNLRFEPAQLGGDGDLALLAYPSLHFYDGRSARFGALQQIADPVTKTVWQNYAELHPNTAARLGVEHGDIVRVRTEAGEIELPAYPHETIREGTVAVAVGQGHQPLAHDIELPFDGKDWNQLTTQRGVNVLSVIPGRLDPASGGLAWLSARVRVEKTGRSIRVADTQKTFDQEYRGFVQRTTAAFVMGSGPDLEHQKPELMAAAFEPSQDPATVDSPYRWGMVIDTDACTGCNACMTACDQENNGHVVGEDLIRVGREMSWVRINRFVSHNGDALEVDTLPMLCQHCGSAPCENVCPVLATYHSPQGLNVMVYNRCIGTRYCSNNCPYKVRRFNYLPYDFYVRGVEKLRFNPDVTVRSKGVMEKCSFCVQRINYAVDDAVNEDRTVRDGEVVTACQQGCPSNAITFGNFKDPASVVSKQRIDNRAYIALEHLNTKPGVAYLKTIRRSPTQETPKGHGGGHHG